MCECRLRRLVNANAQLNGQSPGPLLGKVKGGTTNSEGMPECGTPTPSFQDYVDVIDGFGFDHRANVTLIVPP